MVDIRKVGRADFFDAARDPLCGHVSVGFEAQSSHAVLLCTQVELALFDVTQILADGLFSSEHVHGAADQVQRLGSTALE